MEPIPRFPDVIFDIDSVLSSESDNPNSFVQSVHEFLTANCRIWTSSTLPDMSLHRLTTANSNYVYVASNMNVGSIGDSEPDKVIVRIYGKMNVMFDRETEEDFAVTLAEVGLMPRFFAVFGNGRVEQYIEHSPVNASSFREPVTYLRLTTKLKKLHNFFATIASAADQPLTDQMWVRLNALKQFAVSAQDNLLKSNKLDTAHVAMLDAIVKWDVFKDFGAIRLRALDSRSRLVFGHCDMHHGNVLSTTDGLVIIDFEYSIPTTRGFDLANFFCEFCSDFDSLDASHEMDFSQYPELKQRMGIYRAYLGAAASMEDMLHLEAEVSAYLPFVHLQWAHWGLIKAQESHGSSYDYLRYAYLRYEQWSLLTSSS